MATYLTKVEKFVENAKIEKLKCDIFGDFQTLWVGPEVRVENTAESTHYPSSHMWKIALNNACKVDPSEASTIQWFLTLALTTGAV